MYFDINKSVLNKLNIFLDKYLDVRLLICITYYMNKINKKYAFYDATEKYNKTQNCFTNSFSSGLHLPSFRIKLILK